MGKSGLFCPQGSALSAESEGPAGPPRAQGEGLAPIHPGYVRRMASAPPHLLPTQEVPEAGGNIKKNNPLKSGKVSVAENPPRNVLTADLWLASGC
jgi:hypothetical protein